MLHDINHETPNNARNKLLKIVSLDSSWTKYELRTAPFYYLFLYSNYFYKISWDFFRQTKRSSQEWSIKYMEKLIVLLSYLFFLRFPKIARKISPCCSSFLYDNLCFDLFWAGVNICSLQKIRLGCAHLFHAFCMHSHKVCAWNENITHPFIWETIRWIFVA